MRPLPPRQADRKSAGVPVPKIDTGKLHWGDSSRYPEPLGSRLKGRHAQRLAEAGDLTQFDVNITRLAPGAQSTMRHWHAVEDEFILVLDGEVVLVDDSGETLLTSGDAAAFPGGVNNAHHLVNRSDTAAFILEVSATSPEDRITYPDDGLTGFRRNGVLSFR